MKILTHTFVTAASLLLLATTAFADVTFSDNTFNNGTWTLTSVQVGGGGSTSAGQQVAGGNPGSFRQITNTVNAVANSYIYGVHLNTTATYTPATDGAISTIDYAEDSLLISGFGSGQATGPALQQGGNNYVLITALSTPNFAWTHHSAAGLGATAFGQLTTSGVNTNNHPDFSCSGSLIVFGFFRDNSTPSASGYTQVGGIDNWTNIIHQTSCCTFADSTFNNGSWTLTSVQVGSGGSTSAGQQLAGGNLGSFRRRSRVMWYRSRW